MYWLIALIVIVILIVLWLVFWNKPKETPATKSFTPQAPVQEIVDDLKIIEGVGPKIAQVLNAAGVSSFAQMAVKTSAELRKILDDAGIGAIADPTTWPEQAALAAEGKMDALKELQDKLQGGRKG